MKQQVKHNVGKEKTAGNGKLTILAVILMLSGAFWCLFASFDYIKSIFETKETTQAVMNVEEQLDPELKAELLTQAKAYNARLGEYIEDDAIAAAIADEDIRSYDEQLDSGAPNNAMGWIEVPKAAIEMPIYHGISDAMLSMGAGHQPEASLPIGGKQSFCMISGHSGYSSTRMFDNVRCLEPGDVIGLHVLGDIYEYKITSWSIVDPPSVTIQDDIGDDVLVLVTCTSAPTMFAPKGQLGINSKRLLFYAERVEYNPTDFEVDNDIVAYVNETTTPLIAAMVAILILAVISAAGALRRHRKNKQAQEKHENSSFQNKEVHNEDTE